MEFLRDQWELQKKSAQTKPLRRQVKDAGARTIDAILVLQDQLKVLDMNITKLEKAVTKGQGDTDTMFRIAELLEERRRAMMKKRRMEDSLDLRRRQDLQALRASRYLTARLNALALKSHIRDRLHQRKFEFAGIERRFRTESSDRKLAAHATNAVHRREPGIQTLARRYNLLCGEMADLVKKREAPPRTEPPRPINMENLWGLDVDDDIWLDVGLLDEDGVDNHPSEEFNRISVERKNMQIWLREEWEAVEHAVNMADLSEGLYHHIFLYRKELLSLAITWKKTVTAIPTDGDTPPDKWGPSESEMREEMA
ncbi:hypothetical protein PUNSTDRAFT_139659 [Punctularia strigosozonata HHB-11173 SS5]|uniref:Uncharacterized protein n=1 Tax=Punctularia strigosozonata (strain HHB-11173) TaxID=741275 RepID=R7S0F4_PUNST|nr:uncharacterized protein PUNSTDRAFT_139659 [Punctularia strigosozonata HHB-11173 SS5]EIN03324.1 hypothetical protein PUNSTDRAFT_139659 [Punctularia strigosozonata HHB-11173 SS5]